MTELSYVFIVISAYCMVSAGVEAIGKHDWEIDWRMIFAWVGFCGYLLVKQGNLIWILLLF